MDTKSKGSSGHPESVDRNAHASAMSQEAIEYWIKLRSEARASIGRESHVANNLSLQIPAQQGPALAVASVVAVSFSDASGLAGITVLVSAFMLVCASAISFYLIFRKYNIIVRIVEHVDRAKMQFSRDEIPVSGLFYTHGHLFQGVDRVLAVLSVTLYLLGVIGVSLGFGMHFLVLGLQQP